ncbi:MULTISPECIES: undecaprenyl-diphosphate phosphatase [Alteromonadales]|jgi:undecaprenyl-diphosphatase|uniref:undecaprenyl-diphosphate phosphatase n=2 Tax=Gammaproteobacteria TaxID=1236 RepID=UPI0009774B95|nr:MULTISPECIES: undecaprenyl-diphosphate phosphatase [unclassified Pseudoalteromonas]MAC98802.1 undecaprenyl-diphosphate phosphatase [Pseudomonadales bacterium]QPL42531.1 undecaprenyl-diphosphate phosphatase [Pseudoalteromonas sp. A41-2]HCP99110.1 undecaprenyl-diphosphate phosphatase [Pseudoalteromonas sp.]|tara:strand:- start:5556 stop:6356 length:801 start_codon:yes stop_codon:yes gene_type:complete
MELLHAIFLGILQGITEFLPISSSAHLILAPVLAGWEDQGVAFDLAVHVGTLLAVLLYFYKDVGVLTQDGISSITQKRFVGQGKLTWFLVIATIPATITGLLLLEFIDSQLRSVEIIFFTTLGFGFLLGWADWRPNQQRTLSTLSWKEAALVGVAQAFSLIPGTSRSGATITAGLLLGLSREAASRFSFLLAIPITAMAASAKLLDVATKDVNVDWIAFLTGGITSFLMALTAIHFFLKWLNRFGMWPYVVYRIVLAAIIYFVLMN